MLREDGMHIRSPTICVMDGDTGSGRTFAERHAGRRQFFEKGKPSIVAPMIGRNASNTPICGGTVSCTRPPQGNLWRVWRNARAAGLPAWTIGGASGRRADVSIVFAAACLT